MVSGCSVEDPRGILGCDVPSQKPRYPPARWTVEDTWWLIPLRIRRLYPLFFVRYILVRRVNPIVGFFSIHGTYHVQVILISNFLIQCQHSASNSLAPIQKGRSRHRSPKPTRSQTRAARRWKSVDQPVGKTLNLADQPVMSRNFQ